jgi:hypothetical protein
MQQGAEILLLRTQNFMVLHWIGKLTPISSFTFGQAADVAFRVLLSMELCMATCYRKLNRKYYDDSMALCKKILSSFKDNIAALEVCIEVGHVFPSC